MEKEPKVLDFIPESLRAQLRKEVLDEIQEEREAAQREAGKVSPMMKEYLKSKKLQNGNNNEKQD